MKRLFMLIAAFVAAFGCALCVYMYGASLRSQAEQAYADKLAQYGGDQVEVLIAKQSLKSGEMLKAEQIEKRSWLVAFLPTQALSNKDDVVGKRLSSSVAEGSVLSKLHFEDDTGSVVVPKGKTGLTLPLKDAALLQGFVQVGDSVDIYAQGEQTTSKLLSQTQVLALSSPSKTQGAWVMVAVDPNRVEELVAAVKKVNLYITLPNVNAAQSSGQEDRHE